jgi:hypothetical protein
MRLFFIGVAVGLIRDNSVGCRSMMVHPSQRRDPHRTFYNWVSAARDDWMRILDLPDGDPDKADLLDLFRQAHADIAATAPGIPSFDEVVARLRHAIRRTHIREVNARGGTTTQINWTESYSWILVGGQAMDRGFTVEGLTVTYMPRGLGIGNADTVQQRGRFFGYKRHYLGLCRVFLGPDAHQAFQDYVDHEEDIRQQLIEFRSTNRPLSEWRRQFFLSNVLRPTRNNVIDIPFQRFNLGNDWVYPEGPHDAPEALEANRRFFSHFLSAQVFIEHDGVDLRRDSFRNHVLRNIPLHQVHEDLLTRYRISRLEDSQLFASLLRLIQFHLIDHPDDTCTVFLMAEGHPRRRGYQDGKIKELFQGVQYATQNGRRVITYPGDRRIRADQGIRVQMSYLDLGEPTGLIASNVPHIAVWVPPEMSRDIVSQPQGGPP